MLAAAVTAVVVLVGVDMEDDVDAAAAIAAEGGW